MEELKLKGFINEGERQVFFFNPEAIESIVEIKDKYYHTEIVLSSGRPISVKKEFEDVIEDFPDFFILTLSSLHSAEKDIQMGRVAINPQFIQSVEELPSRNSFLYMIASGYLVKENIREVALFLN